MPKRDFERMREILLHLEGQDSDGGNVWTRNDAFYVQSDDYQNNLLKQAGILEGDYRTTSSFIPDRLLITFSGHDYLDAMRDREEVRFV